MSNDTEYEFPAAVDLAPSLGAKRILTMGEFRAATAHVPDDAPMAVATDGWYECLKGVMYDPAEGTYAVTFYGGDDWDCRYDDPNSPWFGIDPQAHAEAMLATIQKGRRA